jgi:hypothetical protein
VESLVFSLTKVVTFIEEIKFIFKQLSYMEQLVMYVIIADALRFRRRSNLKLIIEPICKENRSIVRA